VGIMLQPFIPTKATQLLDMLGVDKARRNWEWCVVGKDDSYGSPMVDLTKRDESGQLFPVLVNQW
jgi:methionyl-tRNA synthetase